MPILKQLVSSSVHSKRRSRVDLTAEMISAPLGDFRHTMHVGRAGDAFGDTSFLNSKVGELDGESLDERASTSTSKRSLLSRKFRGSKRSQSVTRSDREQRDMLGSLRDSALFVKNAMSLPQLNEKEAAEKSPSKLPKSLSSSPVKKASSGEGAEDEGGGGEAVARRNGAGAPYSPDPLLDEQAFGDLTDLPVVPKASHGLKHAESVMSFHIDLGPSMLGDVLSIMDKDEWGPDEEEVGSCHGDEDTSRPAWAPLPATVAPLRAGQEGKAGPGVAPLPSHTLEDEGWAAAAPSPGSARSLGSHTTRDSSSLSSYTSGVLEERSPAFRGPERAVSAVTRQPDKEFSFMDEEEEDEIRV
ncbi:cdc42 effector protein 4 [Choloepus didactylus]|uniref:cdc42 effector protein 4 n=1 Tax=Choloepus didactylus TaxID=27675 RepID=UPI00189F591C|nr:cdc42 effector protein 4 [Choloepus didactylus]XP_037664552.1 cdc42 effector protein 4 [Choloepus didactylus]